MDDQHPWKRLGRFLSTVFRNIVEDQVFFRSTSIAFTTMITLVPITMVVFSVGGFDQLGYRILETLSRFLFPEGNDEAFRTFNAFTFNARKLGAWGTLIFLFTAVMLLNSLEMHLSAIFKTRPKRGLVQRIATYLASLALTSFLFGAGFGPISGMLDAWNRVPPPEQRVMGILLSLMGAMAGMMMLFGLLNSAKIRFRSAALGSFIGAVGFQAAKLGFTVWTTYSVRQSIIYGSMVFLPLLLVWLNIAWLIVLTAAEITDAHQKGAGRRPSLKTGTPADETDVGWRLYLELSRDFLRGSRPPGIKDLAARLQVDDRRADVALERLMAGGLVHRVDKRPHGYIPARDLSETSAAAVLSVAAGLNPEEEAAGVAAGAMRNGFTAAAGERSVRSFLPETETGTETETGAGDPPA